MAKKRVKAVNAGTFKKGEKRPGQGRPKGMQNRATKNAREAIARFVDGNADRLQAWLDEIAEQDGAKAAFACFSDVLEYHVPKLTRTDVTSGGKPLPRSVSINVVGVQPKR